IALRVDARGVGIALGAGRAAVYPGAGPIAESSAGNGALVLGVRHAGSVGRFLGAAIHGQASDRLGMPGSRAARIFGAEAARQAGKYFRFESSNGGAAGGKNPRGPHLPRAGDRRERKRGPGISRQRGGNRGRLGGGAGEHATAAEATHWSSATAPDRPGGS